MVFFLPWRLPFKRSSHTSVSSISNAASGIGWSDIMIMIIIQRQKRTILHHLKLYLSLPKLGMIMIRVNDDDNDDDDDDDDDDDH